MDGALAVRRDHPRRSLPEHKGKAVKDKAAAGCMTALMIVVFLGLAAAIPGVWMIVVAVVVAMLAWEMWKLQHAANPTPPPSSEGVGDEEPQVGRFTMEEDRPGHWSVTDNERDKA